MGKVEQTYKAKDVEEIIDILLYRPWGYALAVGARRVGMSPNVISVIGMGVGVAAGHLFFYDSIAANVAGIVLWAFGQALDGADGQLARMTNQRTQLGRMLDGISDNVKFASVYLHLGLRLMIGYQALWPIAVMFASGITHSYQSALADYYRNAYLFFVYGSGRAELEDPEALRLQYAALNWRGDPLTKLLFLGYIVYTRRQGRWSGQSESLRAEAVGRFGTEMPEAVRARYRALNRPLLRYYNALTTNTRMIVLYAALLSGRIALFFVFELVLLNLLMVVLWAWLQRSADRRMALFLDASEAREAVPA